VTLDVIKLLPLQIRSDAAQRVHPGGERREFPTTGFAHVGDSDDEN
jgi:hypothetical protein